MGKTTIDHEIRVKLKLNCLEYCVADYIATHKIQNMLTPCAEYLGITLEQADKIYMGLANKHIMCLNGVGVNMEVTDKWENEFKKQVPVKDKINKFEEAVFSFENYTKNMLQDFFLYWSELNKSQTKMRWESEKTWELSKRLARWHKNNNFKKAEHEKLKVNYTLK